MSHSCNDFIRLYEIRGNDVGGAKDRDVCKGLREGRGWRVGGEARILGIVLLLVGGKARAKQGVDCLSLTLTLITLNL